MQESGAFRWFPLPQKIDNSRGNSSEVFDCLWRSPYCHVCSPGRSYGHIMMSRLCDASSRLRGPMLVRYEALPFVIACLIARVLEFACSCHR